MKAWLCWHNGRANCKINPLLSESQTHLKPKLFTLLSSTLMGFHRASHFARLHTLCKSPSLHHMQNSDVDNIRTQELSRDSRTIADLSLIHI